MSHLFSPNREAMNPPTGAATIPNSILLLKMRVASARVSPLTSIR